MAPTYTIACVDEVWNQWRQLLEGERESAGVAIARLATTKNDATLLVRAVVPVPEGSYQFRSIDRLELASSAYVPALARAAHESCVAIFFHTHPNGDPTPSKLDTDLDQQLEGLFRARTGQAFYASVVLGGSVAQPTATGRLYESSTSFSNLRHIRVIAPGEMSLIYHADADQAVLPMHDRQIRAFGRDGQRQIAKLRVGVAGAGGTGSAVIEQLIRLGVGEILVADDDLIDASNVTRIHESSFSDIGRRKVSVAARTAKNVGGRTIVRQFPARVTVEEVAKSFGQCDIVFGCTDDQQGRLVLSRLAYWYLVPVVDMAVVVATDSASQMEVYARVTRVQPGLPCLVCRRRIDLALAQAESLEAGEFNARRAAGYVPALPEPAPAVVTYTTFIASAAVNELLSALLGYGDRDRSAEFLYRLGARSASGVSGSSLDGHYCIDNATWGRGDDAPTMGQLWT